MRSNEALFSKAIALVHKHRAASVVLVQRHLEIDFGTAEAILQRMADETTIVRRARAGLYLYVADILGGELARLGDFAREVLEALTAGRLDADELRTTAIRLGLAQEVVASKRCGEQCACASLFDFPVTCFRPNLQTGNCAARAVLTSETASYAEAEPINSLTP